MFSDGKTEVQLCSHLPSATYNGMSMKNLLAKHQKLTLFLLLPLQDAIKMESSETSLCLLMLLETRDPIRKACTPLWPAHPCHGNSP